MGEVNGVRAINAAHVYADDGSYNVTITATDAQNATGNVTATATISNVAPTLVNLAGPQTASVGTPLAFRLTGFGDPGFTFGPANTTESWTADIDWENNGTYDETVPASNVVQGSAGTRSPATCSAPMCSRRPAATK